MADILETIKAMIRQGASSDEIVDTLKSMGISEDEARKLILLAERDMLRVLRNEIREIAADAFIEQAERMKKDLAAEVDRMVDTRLKLAQKTLTDMIRKEMNAYVSSISRAEDRLSLIERKVYDLEDRVARLETYRPKKQGNVAIKYLVPIIGIGFLVASVILSADKTLATYLFAAGILFVLGGVIFGR
ncbi:MAG: hypothetical protein PWP76_662 [Candidatus Diapherotrites archaeon]|nr:hypothetical protein [Candidatus Diapherotrites archaeon]MDN5367011.1 hypothetical protein [Candidatus Diapherotrites archaeon]